MNSIALFAEKGIENIYKVINKFLEDPTDFAGFTTGLREETSKFEQGVIRDTLELMDEKLRESPERKEKYEIVKRDRRTVVTSLGEVTFKRTYFKDRESKEKTYLVDEITRLDHRERLTEDAKVRMLTEVTEGSYRKSGEATCLNGDRISRQTVKNEIHQLEFPEMEKPEEKRQATTLYIDADEDHVSLQYLEKKGDVQRTEGKYKNNGMLNKIVYVYEGIEREGPKSKRRKLIRPYYICGSYSGEENRKLWVWDEIYQKKMSNRHIFKQISMMGYGKERITADSAEPKSIDELKKYGLRVKGARKGKDSINNGIQFLQDYEIIVHPRCVNFLTEISNYSWSKDRFGKSINVPIDDFNHLMDAMRYAAEDLTRVESRPVIQTFKGGI